MTCKTIVFAGSHITTKYFNEIFDLYKWDDIYVHDDGHLIVSKYNDRVVIETIVVTVSTIRTVITVDGSLLVDGINDITYVDDKTNYIRDEIIKLMKLSYGVDVEGPFKEFLDDYKSFMSTTDPDTKLKIYLSAGKRFWDQHDILILNETPLLSGSLYWENTGVLINNMHILYPLQTGRPSISPYNRFAFEYYLITNDNLSDIVTEMNKQIPVDFDPSRLIGSFIVHTKLVGDLDALDVPLQSKLREVRVVMKGSRNNKWVFHKEPLYVHSDRAYEMMIPTAAEPLRNRLIMNNVIAMKALPRKGVMERLPSSLRNIELTDNN